MTACTLAGPNRATPPTAPRPCIRLQLADDDQREEIYRHRHEVYARELGQHATNADHRLRDALDDANVYIVALDRDRLLGFVSVTPPQAGAYSVDKYLPRGRIPFELNDRTYEVRLLTVLKPHRGRAAAALLMYAALRWIDAQGGTSVIAMGRREVLPMYVKAGLRPLGAYIQSGAVTYDLLAAELTAIRTAAARRLGLLSRLELHVDWRLDPPFHAARRCYHGGAFFDAIGDRLDRLERRHEIINADVLDAWFDPAPRVVAALQEHLPWLLRTSPPTDCGGLVRAVAEARGVMPENILPGAGSSDLIFLTLREWLTPASRVLILDPMYGEYEHVLRNVIGCHVQRLPLPRGREYDFDIAELIHRLDTTRFDLAILVNPNSPTGRYAPTAGLARALSRLPRRTRIWIDETYVDYVDRRASLERFAAASDNVAVCKSMSKVYALSGVRAAYLCGPERMIAPLRSVTPPWAVSLPGQLAAIEALKSDDYYDQRYAETRALRANLAQRLKNMGGIEVIPGVANFLLCHLSDGLPDADTLASRCRTQGLFIRDVRAMGTHLGDRAIRIAIKDALTNRRMISILRAALAE